MLVLIGDLADCLFNDFIDVIILLVLFVSVIVLLGLMELMKVSLLKIGRVFISVDLVLLLSL